MNDTLGMRLRLGMKIEDWRLGSVHFARFEISLADKLGTFLKRSRKGPNWPEGPVSRFIKGPKKGQSGPKGQ